MSRCWKNGEIHKKKSEMKDYTYYLFDADGTLFDTGELIYQCFAYSCRKFGKKQITKEEVLSSMGLTLRSQFEKYLGPIRQEHYHEIQSEYMNYQFSIYKQYLKVFPGVAESLEILKSREKKLSVVTSRKIKSLTTYLKHTRMYDYFDALITPENTIKHKPEPEPALEAMSLLGADKDKTLFIGDSVYDIECGSKAGIDTAFVNWSHNNGNMFKVKPTFCIDDMKDLCA